MAKSSSLVSACGSEYVGGSRAGERAERRRPGCCMEICERKYLLLLTYLHTFIVAHTTYRISVKLLELVQAEQDPGRAGACKKPSAATGTALPKR